MCVCVCVYICVYICVAPHSAGVAQRLFFVHMERSKYGPQHASFLEFENPYHRGGRCRRLGDPALEREDMEMLGTLCSARLGLSGNAHPQVKETY